MKTEIGDLLCGSSINMKNYLLYRPVIFIALMTLLVTACSAVRGSGTVMIEEREVTSFNRVVLGDIGQLVLTQGDQESLTIEAEDNILPLIESVIIKNTLFINFKNEPSAIPVEPIKFHLTMKEIISLSSSGASTIQASRIEADELEIISGDIGKVVIDKLTAGQITVTPSNNSTIEVSGQVQHQTVHVIESANYRGASLKSKTSSVIVDDKGTATVWVMNNLDVEVNGNGDVLYYGDPTVNQTVIDSGKITQKEKPE